MHCFIKSFFGIFSNVGFRFLKFFMIVSFLISSVFAGFVYDENNDVYFYKTNNENPTITVEMLSFDVDFTLDAIYLTDGTNNLEFFFQTEQNFVKNVLHKYSFTLEDFENENGTPFNVTSFTSGNAFDIKLDISSPDELTFSSQASPREFTLYYDSILPVLNNQEPILVPSSKFGNLEFSEPLSELVIRDEDGNLVFTKEISSPSYLSQHPESVRVSFPDTFIGLRTLRVEFVDIAGNRVEQDVEFFFEDKPLEITLLTNQDDPSLNYYFSNTAPELFGNTIYSSNSDAITLTLDTSKKAVCYFSKPSSIADLSILTFEDLIDVKSNPQQLESGSGFAHTISIPLTSSETFFWVGCVNQYDASDSTFLSEQLGIGKQLLSVKTLSGAFNMDVLYPQSLSTTNEFTVDVEATLPAECSINFGGEDIKLEGDQDLTKLTKLVNLPKNFYSTTVLCYDQLHREQKKNWQLEVDPDKGIQITLADSLYVYGDTVYSETSSIDIPFTTSSTTSSCRYSMDTSIDPSNFADYSNATLISENSIQHSVSISGLQKGTAKDVYLYCYDVTNVFPSSLAFKVVYDDSKPQLSDLYFLTSVGRSKKYIDSIREIEVEFNVTSTLPIKEYSIYLTGKNGSSEIKTFAAGSTQTNFVEELVYKKNNEDYTHIVILAKNIFEKVSSELKAAYFLDTTSPTVSLVKSGEHWKITCQDSETDCYKAFYGLSQSEDSCVASFSYDLENSNESIDASEHAYVCARAINGVGLSSKTEIVATGFIPAEKSGDALPFDNIPFEEGEESNETIVEESIEEEEEEPVEPIKPTTPTELPEEESNTPLILGALIFIVATLGGGGYYAYKKGYLNDQLRKMGIKVPQSQPGTSNAYYSSPSSKTTKGTGSLKRTSKKSNYDHHLNKLNKFLDSTLEKKSSVFDSFSGSQKGRVKNYKDTMTSGTTKQSAEDNFYKASSKADTNSIKKQGEDFEDYYKKKKESSAKKGDEKKS